VELIQLVLPVYDNAGERHPRDLFRQTLAELTDRFGGVTAFTRAPAEGLWEDDSGRIVRDDVIVVEVMADGRADAWWAEYRRRLQGRFRQETILLRALECRRL
jgi:hypothetical protein